MCLPSWARARIAAQRLDDLARLRRVRDRIDRDHARPLDVEALARGVGMAAGHLSRQFRVAYGMSPYAYLVTRRVERAAALLLGRDIGIGVGSGLGGPVRNREASAVPAELASSA
jgi:AraC-like DNA-binding protein